MVWARLATETNDRPQTRTYPQSELVSKQDYVMRTTDKSLGRVHLSKNQTSDISDVLKAPSVLDREPDVGKQRCLTWMGLICLRDCFSPSIDQDNLETAGLSQV